MQLLFALQTFFLSEKQIRERLGDPIYSRFDAVIHFTEKLKVFKGVSLWIRSHIRSVQSSGYKSGMNA